MIEMHWGLTCALLLGGILIIMFAGVAVGLAFFAVNLVGAWFFLGHWAGLQQFIRNDVVGVSAFSLVPVPLFIFMGEMLFHSGLAIRAIDGVNRVISRVPGRLPIVVIVAGTLFSAISGSTIATTTMLGSLMLPDMLRRGYDSRLSIGAILGIGGVDMLIPPSGLAVLLGSLSTISISDLLLGGTLPGFILAGAFVVYIVLSVKFRPHLAPADDGSEFASATDRWIPLFRDVLPLVAIFVLVIVSMVAGWATPTESAAVGASATILVAAIYRAITLENLVKSMIGTAAITGAILLIVMGATTFGQILALSGGSDGAISAIVGNVSSPALILSGMIVILLVLGCFVDQLSMMLMTLPFFMPLVQKYDFDPVWFGVIFMVCMQIGLLTPPFGLILFAMRSVAPPEIKTVDIYWAVAPYVVMSGLLLLAVIYFPGIATFLPKLLAG